MAAVPYAAQQPAATGPNVAQIEKVKDNLYMITGGGGNTAAYITANGVVLVDTKLANWGQAILDKVRTVSDKPITHIINTHTHGDHVGSNEFFDPKVEIVAQENTAANMAKMPAFADASKKHGLSDRTFKDKHTVLGGNDAIDLYYFGPAHTNGDAFVVFRNLRVMHAGDAFSGPNNPIMDTNNGGYRRRVSGHARQGCGGHQGRGHRDPGPCRGHDLAGLRGLRRVHEELRRFGECRSESGQDRGPGPRGIQARREVQGLQPHTREGEHRDDLQGGWQVGAWGVGLEVLRS